MTGEPEFPPSKRTSFREQVMNGDVPKGYEGLVVVSGPGEVRLTDNPSERAVATGRDVTEERIAFLMKDPVGFTRVAPSA